MLAQVEKQRIPGSTVRWEQDDLATWAPREPVDLIYSNAASSRRSELPQ
jgi:trans-aconitate methyltransferase